MSPEGLLLNVYSEKTDVWALGIVIYEMIHGKTPFGYCRLDSELKYWIVRPLADNMFKKDIHPCFKQLILTLLEVDENRRISIGELSKSHFVENLEEIMRNIKSENSDKRKFSFNGNVVTP
jgi:serine/threonine protein kinase